MTLSGALVVESIRATAVNFMSESFIDIDHEVHDDDHYDDVIC